MYFYFSFYQKSDNQGREENFLEIQILKLEQFISVCFQAFNEELRY